MKRLLTVVTAFLVCSIIWTGVPALAQEPILIGVPTAITAIEGKESLNAVEMAVSEINAKGGVKVGDAKRPLKIETIDLRDAVRRGSGFRGPPRTGKDHYGKEG